MYDNKAEILEKMAELTKRWKDNTPKKYSDEYWRYRADQNLWLSLKKQLKTAQK